MTKPFIIVASQFNKEITESLHHNTQKTLDEKGYEKQHDTVWVPGAFEIPVVTKALLQKDYSVAICIGCVIRGETPHFDYICSEVSRALMDLSLTFCKPTIFGVLTANTWAEASHRSGLLTDENQQVEAHQGKSPSHNKGKEFANAAIEMYHTVKEIGKEI